MRKTHTICLIAMSRDFFESDLPKPELSGDEDFPDKLLRGESLSSCFGGTSFRIFITLSTILVPIKTGLTLSLALACIRLSAGTELPLLEIMPLGGRPREGEHDCRLTLPLETGSTEEERALGAPGLPLVAEIGLSGRVVLKFGGTSREKPGISEGFHDLGFTVGELVRGGTGFLAVVGPGLVTAEEGDLMGGADVFVTVDSAAGRRVGVDALDVVLDAGNVGLDVGVEDLAVVLDRGVEDLAGTVGLFEGNVAREVGVEDLEGLDTVFKAGLDVVRVDLDAVVRVGLDVDVNVGRPVGVAGLEPGPPDDEGL
ncbi:hypothetical protein Acr_02g0003380 [Actinidia rufa]|uniref:Uncharacterized protein n=1 Tax=Actinidia rufa TaxID=165716 RepID=A0A7J0E6N6_9ERIC|nr:hypothetical protein Acr_02g0003380 [Actinidia rufa]